MSRAKKQPKVEPEKPKYLYAKIPSPHSYGIRGDDASNYVKTCWVDKPPSYGRWYRVPMHLVEVVEIDHVAKVVSHEP